jgi:hypothetical protein
MWFALLWSCRPPDDDPGGSRDTVPSPPATPCVPTILTTATSPTAPELPVGPTLVVDPLVIGTPTPIGVGAVTAGIDTTLWTGSFGGTSCPPELSGACLPIGSATIAATGTSDATGLWTTTWTAPAGSETTYVVFVATTEDGFGSLPVMRRVWATLPNWSQWETADLFDPANDGYLTYEPTEITPGDWMDLGLDGPGDAYDIFAMGNQRVVTSATSTASSTSPRRGPSRLRRATTRCSRTRLWTIRSPTSPTRAGRWRTATG